MSELLSRFDFRGVEFSRGMYASAVIIWLIVVACAISSILNQPMSPKRRFLWIAVVVLVPVAGVAVYLPFSCRKEQYAPLLAIVAGFMPKVRR